MSLCYSVETHSTTRIPVSTPEAQNRRGVANLCERPHEQGHHVFVVQFRMMRRRCAGSTEPSVLIL